jgi:uncharacterized surface protein with fasciclin (FAS1) repeats
MPSVKTFAAICLCAVLGFMGPRGARAKDLMETAQDAGTFTILLAAVKATGLTPILTGKGPITLFAPTDDAFSKLPRATLEGLFKPENKDKLKDILTYHVVMGKVTSRDVLGKRLEAATAEGGSLLIDGNRGITVDDAKVIKADIVADNGFIHVIDTVVIPK